MNGDDLIARQVQLLRLSAGERAKVFAILRAMEEELIDKLFGGQKLADISREDKARLLKQAQALIATHYGDISDTIGQTLCEVGALEAAATAADLGDVYAGAIVPAIPPEGVLKRIVDNTLIDGAPSAEWWRRQAGDVQFRFMGAVRQGLAAGETNDEIIRRIRGRAVGYQVIEGKRVYNYAGGIMDIARHHAAAQVQTSVMAVANQARQDTYDENDDIIKGYRQLSTLDSHTCFSAGHMVTMANGSTKAIEQIKPGEYVIGGLTGKPRRVLATRQVTKSTVDIYTDLGHTFRCTPEHRFMTDNGWVEANDLKNKRVRTYVPEREAVCGDVEGSGNAVAAALQCDRAESRCVGSDSEAHAASGAPRGGEHARYARGSDGCGDCTHCEAEHDSAERIQPDQRRGGRNRCAAACVEGCGRGVCASIQGGSRDACARACGLQNLWPENLGAPARMVGHAGCGATACEAILAGSARGSADPESQPHAGDIGKDGRGYEEELAGSGVPCKGQCGARSEAGRVAQGSGVGRGKESQDGRGDAQEVAGSGVCRQACRSAGGSGYSCANAGRQQEEKDVHAGSRCCACREDSSEAFGKLERSSVPGAYATVTRIEKAIECEVYDIQVEDPDHSFICNGVVVHNSTICVSYSGAEWDKKKNPINGNKLAFVNPGGSANGVPRHWNCRSVMLPITKTFRELGLDADEFPTSSRSATGGPVAADMTFDAFLKRKGDQFADELLGPGRAQLWRDKKITLQQLLDQSGRPLTLKQLRRLYAS